MARFVKHKAPTNASVGVSSAQVLARNNRRGYASFINDSANKIYLAFGFAAVVGSGTPISANGGSYEMNRDNLTLQAVNAIADGASSNLAIQEANR